MTLELHCIGNKDGEASSVNKEPFTTNRSCFVFVN